VFRENDWINEVSRGNVAPAVLGERTSGTRNCSGRRGRRGAFRTEAGIVLEGGEELLELSSRYLQEPCLNESALC
jgi:hypothetical protein